MDTVAVVIFVGWCGVLSWIDLRERRLPNRLTLPGAIVVWLYATLTGRGPAALVGGLALAAVYLVVHLVMPAAFGAGDVKLALGTGAVAGLGGASMWTWAALAAPMATAVAGMVLLLRGNRRVLLPHGPAMCSATLWGLWLG